MLYINSHDNAVLASLSVSRNSKLPLKIALEMSVGGEVNLYSTYF